MTEAPASLEELNQNNGSSCPEMACASSLSVHTLDAEIQPMLRDNPKHEQDKPCSDDDEVAEIQPMLRDNPKHEQDKPCSDDEACDEVSVPIARQMSGEEDGKQVCSNDEEMVDGESYARAGDTDENATGGKQVNVVACKFYVKTGHCRFGKECRYSHDAEAKSSVDTAEMKDEEVNSSPPQVTSAHVAACKFYAKTGHCRFGEQCRNSHDAEIMQADDEMKDEVINSPPPHVSSVPVVVCKFYAKTGSCRFGKQCRYLHAAETTPAVNTTEMKIDKIKSPPRQPTRAPVIPCKFYVTSGHCRFSDKCRYLHDAEVVPAVDIAETRTEVRNSQPGEMKKESNNSPLPQGASASVCRFFAKTQHCRFGERCRNLHVAEIKPAVATADMRYEVLDHLPQEGLTACKFYIRTGHCRFGDQCRYSHEAEVMLADDDIEMTIEIINSPSTRSSSRKTSSTTRKQVDPEPTSSSQKQGSRAVKTCRYFRVGKCTQGDNCKFRHLSNTETSEDSNVPNGQNSQLNSHEPKPTSSRQQEQGSRAIRACRFFKVGKCTKGDNCPFWHPSNSPTSADNSVENGQNTQANIPEANQASSPQQKQNSHAIRTCRYFKAGKCMQGDNCKFRHPSNAETSEDSSDRNGQNFKVISPERQSVLSLDEMSVDHLEKLRETEIQQLKKRYRNVEETQEEPRYYKFVFVPTDPDWPYDVKALELSVSFPATYPKEVMQLVVPEQNLPLPIRQQVEGCSTTWLEEKSSALKFSGKVELLFRPFLRWLDRNLEEMFTKGLMQYQRELLAQAAGLQFLPASALQRPQESSSQGDLTGDDSENTDSDMTPAETTYADEATSNDGSDHAATKHDNASVNSLIDPARRGTEVKLQNLQLSENVATLMATKVGVIVQCERCHTVTEVSTVAARVNSVACLKCSMRQLVVFRPAIVHSFSPVLGYLDLEGCVAFDLVLLECTFHLACLNCSEQTKIQGLATGSPKELWCHHCHQKMIVAISSVRFTQLQPIKSIDSKHVHTIEVKVPRKVARDPVVQPGSPLPDDGTCRHYKKSYRWLRFPCCGKAYPCDKCHDEKETGHEMKFANRMICGFCAKEQPFAMEGFCTGCQSSMTKKSTPHWEGGKGCRDKIKMSRGDAKKFANSSKTISRKAEQKSGQNAKTTKLRHV